MKQSAILAGQYLLIVPIHFWIGAYIGLAVDRLQQTMSHEGLADITISKRKPTAGERVAFGSQVTLAMFLLALAFTLFQYLLRSGRGSRSGKSPCVREMLNTVYRNRIKDAWDAHTLHGGFAMFFGMAWTSGTSMAKLTAALDY